MNRSEVKNKIVDFFRKQIELKQSQQRAEKVSLFRIKLQKGEAGTINLRFGYNFSMGGGVQEQTQEMKFTML